MKKINQLLLCTVLLCNNAITPRESTTIFQEARTGNKEAIKQRIENCENCAQKDENGNTALHIAAAEGHKELVEILTTEPDYSSWGSWIYSCLYAATLPNKNEKNKDGNTPTHCAIENGHIDATECLLKKKVNTELSNKKNLSTVFSAIDKDDPQFIPLFVTYGLIQQKLNGNTLLHYAIKEKKFVAAAQLAENKNLVSSKNSNGETPAMLAAEQLDPHMLQILKEKNVDLNDAGSNGLRPIHIAAMRGNSRILEFLLENNIFVDTTDNEGNTPLHYSAAHNKENSFDLLLVHKADIQKRNNNGKDIFALAAQNKHYKLINRFTKNPIIDINARDNNGQTTFMRATITGDHDLMRHLISCDVNICIIDNHKENVLHKAARNGDEQATRILLENNQKLLSAFNNHDDSPLFVAIQNGHSTIARLFIAEYGAPSRDGIRGNTPAHTAAIRGDVEALRHCLAYDAHMITQPNRDDRTPFILAVKNGNLDATDFLLSDREFMNGTIGIAINLANHNKDYRMVELLRKKEVQRMDECTKIANQPTKIKNVQEKITVLHNQLCQQNGWYFITYLQYQPAVPKRYSANELYYKPEAERTQISLEYTKILNEALQEKMKLEQELNIIVLKEQQEQLKNDTKRLEQERAHAAAQRQILAEKNRQEEEHRRIVAEQAAELNRFSEQHNELERIRKQKEADDAKKAQAVELKKINEQNTALNDIALQKAELDYYAQQKALADAERARQEKHNQALEGQHIPANLQPSAPPMEDIAQHVSCTSCGGKVPAKPLPCVKCKKKFADICTQCIKKHKGRCPQCWDNYNNGVEKQKGECCIGAACCTEEKGVTIIPCENCKKESSSDRICPACLNICIKKNQELNQPERCPRCGKNTLNETLIEKILSQKK